MDREEVEDMIVECKLGRCTVCRRKKLCDELSELTDYPPAQWTSSDVDSLFEILEERDNTNETRINSNKKYSTTKP